MYQSSPNKQENSPFVQMLYLLLFAIGGLIVFALLGMVLVFLTSGIDGLKGAAMNDMRYIGAFKILLVAQQIGLFLAPAIFLAVVERKKLTTFYGVTAPKINWLLLVALLSICWMPLMGLTNEWNQKMVFPDFLASVERWMRAMEDSAAKATEAILKMKNVGDLVVNLLVIAVTPAICEELIFRGAVQRTVFRIKSNPHVAIWISAIIFSAIHFQFYGFLPRLLLGAAFGYVYYFTGSIWYAVFAHFLNNAYAVCVAYYLQMNNQSYTNADDIDMPWYGYVISAILTLALFVQISKKFKVKSEKSYDEHLQSDV
ncbi:CPBP family intramembrane glutamic endopeptidase [Pedobacter sp. SL55]|uniref:CPBP family intramembrane glutamic endopeptidase n=1 Tax=Pedobacter sp. SL55 TaxID=2995161 RepID=UPI00226DFF56|nr:CPBP family intramembrane glutamic endopeptidase [Pedobacter sp. SL55]WAC41781.1 CPBP family intramembrane metalloprotease [Pedobacter sp. SL55]